MPCTTGKIRIAYGSTPNQGLFQKCVNGVWQAQCRSGWSCTQARVACRQLGYTGLLSNEPIVWLIHTDHCSYLQHIIHSTTLFRRTLMTEDSTIAEALQKACQSAVSHTIITAIGTADRITLLDYTAIAFPTGVVQESVKIIVYV